MAEKVLDVVCRMLVDVNTAPAATTYQAGAYYFCGSACQVAFEENPEQYLEGADNLIDTAPEGTRSPWRWRHRS